MHIFEYSGITESIPIDIAENIAKIESLRAMDRIREDVYSKELKVARESAKIMNVSFLLIHVVLFFYFRALGV